MDKFFENVADLLDTDTKITAELSIDSVGAWDSLSIISFLAMVDVEYDKQLKVVDFKDAKTFGDLFAIVMK